MGKKNLGVLKMENAMEFKIRMRINSWRRYPRKGCCGFGDILRSSITHYPAKHGD